MQSSSRQEPPERNAPIAERIETVTDRPQDRGDDPPKPVRSSRSDTGLRGMPGGEGSGECNRRILPLGRLSGRVRIVSHWGSIGRPVSRMPFDDQVQAFLLRPIDRLSVSLRGCFPTKSGRNVSPRRSWWSRSAQDGYRDLGRESPTVRMKNSGRDFEDLKERGLAGVHGHPDGHTASEALSPFLGTSWQMSGSASRLEEYSSETSEGGCRAEGGYGMNKGFKISPMT